MRRAPDPDALTDDLRTLLVIGELLEYCARELKARGRMHHPVSEAVAIARRLVELEIAMRDGEGSA